MNKKPQKIVIIGPESTGKSTLCAQLAQHYNSLWVPEYAREFLLKNGTNYTYDDLLTIAKGQIALEDEYADRMAKSYDNLLPLFIDTNMYVMKVWCEFVFGKCHPWILDRLAEREYQFYLLCNVDLPWIKDELREYPDLPTRHKLYLTYKDIVVNSGVQWGEVTGNDNQRLAHAVAVLDKHLKQGYL